MATSYRFHLPFTLMLDRDPEGSDIREWLQYVLDTASDDELMLCAVLEYIEEEEEEEEE